MSLTMTSEPPSPVTRGKHRTTSNFGIGKFWVTIDAFGPEFDVEAFVDALSDFDGDSIMEFHELLAKVIQSLNTDLHQRQPIVDSDDPDTIIPMSEDSFLDARLAVVASGLQTWQRVVDTPSALAGSWPLMVGQDLDEAVGRAYERSTGEPWANLSLDFTAPVDDVPVQDRSRWVFLHANPYVEGREQSIQRLPAGYEECWWCWEATMNDDPRLWEWWDSVVPGGATLELSVEFNLENRTRSGCQSTKDFAGRPEIHVRLDVPALDALPPSADHDEADDLPLIAAARQHLGLLMNRFEKKFGASIPITIPADPVLIRAEIQNWRTANTRREHEEELAKEQWDLKRSSEHIWRGRAPDGAVDQLIIMTRAGKRYTKLPQAIAALRTRYSIQIDPQDAERLAAAGYSPAE